MIYELRTSTVKQRSLSEAVKAAGIVSLEVRKDDYGKLEGCWQTEIGPLNQVVELWSYQDLNQRARLLAELNTNPRWSAEYMRLFGPHLIRQEIRLLNDVRAPKAPLHTPNIYEFRNYRTTPGAVTRWLQLFTAVLEVREKYTRMVGLWATEAPQVNEVCHIWVYSDLNARAAARAAMLEDPGWQDFLRDSTGLLEELHSTIMLPAPHSPLK
jgi:NIPSNAP